MACLTQIPREFDFENSHWPSQFHHTGPFHDGNGRAKVEFPWERLTGEPLIYASMGTILNGRLDVFRTIVAALAKHKDLQLVLSVGDQVDPGSFRQRNRFTVAVAFLPVEVLARDRHQRHDGAVQLDSINVDLR